ncbi:MAG: flagellar basal body rod protein FlgC [Pseudomonadota bacterium]
MNVFAKAMNAAASGMNAQGFRMRVISENVANTDTPGYQSKQISFENTYDRAADINKVEVGRMTLDLSPLQRSYDPAHPLADESGYVEMSNVNMVSEMADSREAGRSYEANLATFNQARTMYSSLLDLLKR